MTRRFGGLVLALSIFAVAAQAQAAASRYAGNVKGGGGVSFQVSGSSVSRLQLNASVSCVSVAPARSGIDVYIVAPARSAALSRAGKFTAKLNLPKQKLYANGKWVSTLYSVHATVDGSIRGRTASGTVKVTYSKYWSAYNPGTGFYQLTIASCFAKTSWSAARR